MKMIKVRAKKMIYYKNIRHQVGKELLVKEKDFSEKSMVRIGVVTVADPSPVGPDKASSEKIEALESELKESKEKLSELEKQLLEKSSSNKKERSDNKKESEKPSPAQTNGDPNKKPPKEGQANEELAKLNVDDLIAKAAVLGLSKNRNLSSLKKNDIIDLILKS